MREKYGISSYGLKLLALAAMVLDHIHQFFSYTNAIPHIFAQVGRISGPIFIFLLVEGFFHTRNCLKYFLKIYAVAAVMTFVKLIILSNEIYITIESYPFNGILSLFALLLIAYYGFELLKKKQYLLGLAICFYIFVVPYIFDWIYSMDILSGYATYTVMAFFPMHNFISDGGTPYFVLGLLMYLFRNKRILQVTTSLLACTILMYYNNIAFAEPISFSELIYPHCHWMMLFAAIFILLYNGKRGGVNSKIPKSFFYIFYPLHIYALYFTSYLLQKL